VIYKTIEKKKFTAIKWILIAVFSLFNIVYIISAKAWGDDSVKISQIDQEYKYIRCELDLTCEDGNINDPTLNYEMQQWQLKLNNPKTIWISQI